MKPVLTPMDLAAVIARATVYPWIVELRLLRPDGSRATRLSVEWRGAAEGLPVPEDLVGPDEHFAGADVFPVERFLSMPAHVRQRYVSHYRAWRMATIARAKGKAVEQLRSWEDFDPISLDEDVQTWLRPGRYVGD